MGIRLFRSAARQVIANMYYATNHFLSHLKGKVLILTYHRVISERELGAYFIQPGMYVRHNVFEKQMRFLKEHFNILSFKELLEQWEQKALKPDQRYCIITFDDGWRDHYLYAYPILRKYDVSATIFLPTAYIGTNEWFWSDKIGYLLSHYESAGQTPEMDELLTSPCEQHPWVKYVNGTVHTKKIDLLIEMYKRLPQEEIHKLIEQIRKTLGFEFPNDRVFMNWEEIEEMSQQGISFGSHSCTHKIFNTLPIHDIQKEIEGSLDTIQRKRTNYVPIFCYPNGVYTQEIATLVKTAGYQAAVSTRFGLEGRCPSDRYGLKRISIHNDISTTIPLFVFRISGLNHPPIRKYE